MHNAQPQEGARIITYPIKQHDRSWPSCRNRIRCSAATFCVQKKQAGAWCKLASGTLRPISRELFEQKLSTSRQVHHFLVLSCNKPFIPSTSRFRSWPASGMERLCATVIQHYVGRVAGMVEHVRTAFRSYSDQPAFSVSPGERCFWISTGVHVTNFFVPFWLITILLNFSTISSTRSHHYWAGSEADLVYACQHL